MRRDEHVIEFIANPLRSVAVIGAHCNDVAIGAGATLLQISRQQSGTAVFGLVLTGGGTIREIEERDALAAMCSSHDIRLTVADLPFGKLRRHRDRVEEILAEFHGSCEPDLIFAPQRDDYQEDHGSVAAVVSAEFRDGLVLGYEVLKCESDFPTPNLYLPVPAEVARRKMELLRQCYPSQRGSDYFDDETLLGLMRVRGVQCRSRYAEGFVLEKAAVTVDPLYSPN